VAPDRMFRVIVLGGIALAACGGSTQVPAGDGGTPGDAPADATDAAEEFPSELPAIVDSGPNADVRRVGDASVDADSGFPQEGPPPSP
jgi:hypothetical protein